MEINSIRSGRAVGTVSLNCNLLNLQWVELVQYWYFAIHRMSIVGGLTQK